MPVSFLWLIVGALLDTTNEIAFATVLAVEQLWRAQNPESVGSLELNDLTVPVETSDRFSLHEAEAAHNS